MWLIAQHLIRLFVADILTCLHVGSCLSNCMYFIAELMVLKQYGSSVEWHTIVKMYIMYNSGHCK